MDEIYLYFVTLPGNVNEMVVPCLDGYTIYIDNSLSHAEKLDAYYHAMKHIEVDDWHSGMTADQIEGKCHEQKEAL